MFGRFLRRHGQVGALAVGAPIAMLTSSTAHADSHVYTSGEVLGRGVRLEYWKAKHENVAVLDFENEFIQLGMTRIRDHRNEGDSFTRDANAVLRASIGMALAQLPNDEEAVVKTPAGYKAQGLMLEDGVKVCAISIVANPELEEDLYKVMEESLPFESKVGNIMVNKLGTGDGRIVKDNIPDDVASYQVLLVCPDFPSFEHINSSMEALTARGVKQEDITVVTLVTCPEAADKFCETYADAHLVTASYDHSRDKKGRIIPGIGQFEDRYLGAQSGIVQDATLEKPSEESSSSWWPFGGSK